MILLAAVLVSVALVASAALIRSPEGTLRRSTRRQCLVSCKDGHDFSGVLWSADRGCLVLRNAAILEDGGSVSVDGEVVILRADLAFIQFP